MDKKGVDYFKISFITVGILLILLLLVFGIQIIKYMFFPEEKEYCKTTFKNEIIKYCTIEFCHNSGCEFKCDDGSKIDSSYYVMEC